MIEYILHDTGNYSLLLWVSHDPLHCVGFTRRRLSVCENCAIVAVKDIYKTKKTIICKINKI